VFLEVDSHLKLHHVIYIFHLGGIPTVLLRNEIVVFYFWTQWEKREKIFHRQKKIIRWSIKFSAQC
jgi:hypothetical protein